MFLDNKYSRWYFSIIENAVKRSKKPDTGERHHIIPKSLGGSNSKNNIVLLTLREHYVAHLLLPRALRESESVSKMLYALHLLSRRTPCLGSRSFEIARKALVAANQLRQFSDETKRKISEKAKLRGVYGTKAATEAAKLANRGRKHGNEMKERLSNSLTGRKLTDEHKVAIGRASTGRKMTDENKKKLLDRLRDCHHNRYEWVLIDPLNNIVRTKNAIQYCGDNNLSYTALRYKAQAGDSRPVSRGKSAGWIVFAVKKLK